MTFAIMYRDLSYPEVDPFSQYRNCHFSPVPQVPSERGGKEERKYLNVLTFKGLSYMNKRIDHSTVASIGVVSNSNSRLAFSPPSAQVADTWVF